MTDAQRLLEKWQHLIEPEALDGWPPVTWPEVLGLNARVTEGADSVLVTLDGDLAGNPICNIWVAAGELEQVLALVRDAERDAAARGCTKMVYLGRRGWQRAAPDYKIEAVMAVKEL